jgi:hypothetical protein
MNQSDKEISSTVSVNGLLTDLDISRTYSVRVWNNGKPQTEAVFSDGKVGVTVSPKGAIALAIDSLDRLYPEFDISVRMIGGGARSALWAQMNADVTNKPYSTVSLKDVSMWGAILLAGNAVGLFPDLKAESKKKAVIKNTFIPDPKAGEAYRKYKNLYKEFLVTMRDNFAKLY